MRSYRFGSRAALLSVLLLCCPALPAEAQEVLELPRLTGPIQLDGRPDEAAWQEITPLPVVMQMPHFDQPPSQPTEIRIAYDDQYLYVGARCYDDPANILGTSLKRDILTRGIDYVGVFLDTFDDNENALAFLVTPTGVRVDFTVFNDAQGAAPLSISWNTYWDAEVTRNEEGWFAEMRIPFSSLRFQDEDSRVVMGLTAFRWIAHNSESITFPAIPPQWGFLSFAKPSQAQQVAFEGVHSRKPLYVSPYALGGVGQSFALNEASTAYARADDLVHDVGLDIKYGLTSNLTLDLTVNTDFAQVEADNQQVNLTRFSLFFPEKRLFFQERAAIFDFGAPELSSVLDFAPSTSNQLFYSRRIGLYEGYPVRIFGGARLVGRLGGWDIGLLNMQTGREPNVLAELGGLSSENFGVARLRRQVFNPYSYAGGMVTSRIGIEGGYNITYGLDGLFRPFGDEYVSLTWTQTFDESAEVVSPLERARVHARWERRRFDGFGYDFSFSRSGEQYHPSLGFALRQDYIRLGDRVFYGWLPGEASPLQRHQISLYGAAFLRNEDGTTESAEFGPGWEGALKSGANVRVMAALLYEDLRGPLRFSEATEVPEGSYTFGVLQGLYETPGGRIVRMKTTAAVGSFFDGHRLSLGLEPRWVLSRHLELSGFYGIDRIRFRKRDEQFYAHIGRLRLEGALNTKLSVAAFMQYNSATDGVITNVRLRYNPREGDDLYLVYNEGMNTDRYRLDPVLPFTSSRTIMVKYTHTLSF
ncbi:MAG: DUF5916 domain-containing protein [Rhodothermales bacterium]